MLFRSTFSRVASPTARSEDKVSSDLIGILSDELLGKIFSRLDDVSLACASLVCRRWSDILSKEERESEWHRNTHGRWPLFLSSPRPMPCGEMDVCLRRDFPWRRAYTSLVLSAPCIYCLYQNELKQSGDETIAWTSDVPVYREMPFYRQRLYNEGRTLSQDPPEGIRAQALDSSLQHWQASIAGPPGSPYEGGRFYLSLWFPAAYPCKPPLVRFLTKVFHPNVSRHGDIGIDILQQNWSSALDLSKILVSIQSLFTDPYCYVSAFRA
ncbi:unnamed protein product [Darwinula stevensoni]|uniref:Ubiquitin-conjugating enzyme n=1 Tax=Darwinula stevensoni TaxID=69355 RepID=A0A7R9FTX2_9CRUS|nr:unnamed protein product [Darwinula stevensoni]CAG0906561.1 unnamed protein product [Darwinula stevensoni]